MPPSAMLTKGDNKPQRAAHVTPFTSSTRTKEGATHTFLVDAMTESQVSDTYAMICAAAQQGQGFGLGEYVDEGEFRADIRDGFRFAVLDKDGGGRMVAAFILAVSKYSRGCPVADPFIVVRHDQRGRGLGRLCMDLCVELAARLRFLGMYVDTFSNNAAMLRIIRRVPGLKQVGCLPLGGLMKDGEVVSTLIFYKDLRPQCEG